MFYIVIGQSGAGKTTFVKNKFLKPPVKIIEDTIPYTIGADGMIALGRYYVGKRTEGTDTLSYNAKNNIKNLLLKLKDKDIVMEGDRINNREIFDFIAKLGVPVELYLVTCSIATSMERLQEAGSTITLPFVKTTKTKSKNMFMKYASRFNGKIVNTDK